MVSFGSTKTSIWGGRNSVQLLLKNFWAICQKCLVSCNRGFHLCDISRTMAILSCIPSVANEDNWRLALFLAWWMELLAFFFCTQLLFLCFLPILLPDHMFLTVFLFYPNPPPILSLRFSLILFLS